MTDLIYPTSAVSDWPYTLPVNSFIPLLDTSNIKQFIREFKPDWNGKHVQIKIVNGFLELVGDSGDVTLTGSMDLVTGINQIHYIKLSEFRELRPKLTVKIEENDCGAAIIFRETLSPKVEIYLHKLTNDLEIAAEMAVIRDMILQGDSSEPMIACSRILPYSAGIFLSLLHTEKIMLEVVQDQQGVEDALFGSNEVDIGA